MTQLPQEVRHIPAAGTPAWCALPDDHPDKMSAVIYAGIFHVLAIETAQEHLADASKAVAASADWPTVAREARNLRDAEKAGRRIPRQGAA